MLTGQKRKKVKKVIKGLTKASGLHAKQAKTLKEQRLLKEGVCDYLAAPIEKALQIAAEKIAREAEKAAPYGTQTATYEAVKYVLASQSDEIAKCIVSFAPGC